jgi:hypothetical protein
MSKIEKDQQIGITETGDICFHLEAFDDLCRANIIVTKRLTAKLIAKLVEHKDKCIFHFTITGMGNSKLEPMTPSKEQSFKMFNNLITAGFPVEQVVLRVDPIIPTSKGIVTAMGVLKLFKDSGITRIRYSSFDMYEHVKERFAAEGIKLPFETFHADLKDRKILDTTINDCAFMMNAQVEACGEPGIQTTGCISIRDLEILGLQDEIMLVGSANQRGSCSCASNKTQLIKCKPAPCENGCVYCFWRDGK